MSGHSKWANIKHRKAASDSKKGKVYTKVAKEIESAARQGGGDPEANYTLRLAMDKGRAVNMPSDNIERAIKRGTGELQGDALEEIYYEGYGPNGTALIFKCLTDNRNRTVGEIRSTLKRGGGTLAENGAVAWQFNNKGVISIPLDGNDEEEVMLLAIDAGAEDVEVEDGYLEVVTAREDLQRVAESLKQNGIAAESVDLSMIPQHMVALSVDEQMQVMGLIERIEELDDVQEVYTNIEFTDEAMEAAG